MAILEQNLEQNSSQAQLSMGDLGERVLKTKEGVDGALKRMRNDLSEKMRKTEEIAVMCEKSRNQEIIPFGKIIRESGDVNITNNDGNCLLFMLVGIRDIPKLTESLLAHPGILVNKKNDFGITALIQTQYKKNSEMEAILLARDDILVNGGDRDGETVLMAAMLEGNIKTVELLLARDDILVNEKCGKRNLTALIFISSLKTIEAVHLHALKLLLADPRINLREHDQGEIILASIKHKRVRSLIEAKMREQGIEF